MTQRGFVVPPGGGRSVWSLGGRFTEKLGGDLVDGRVAIVEVLATRAAEPPRHIHHREDELWYVLDGQMTFQVGDVTAVASAGAFAFAPKGVAHAFTIDVEPTRVLVLATPSGFERFALELGVPADGDEMPAGLALPGPEILGPVAARYDIEIVGPPIRLDGGPAS
ncbi:MAG: cupin domain-containing protein [Candidatus Limnocylindria bacterium]